MAGARFGPVPRRPRVERPAVWPDAIDVAGIVRIATSADGRLLALLDGEGGVHLADLEVGQWIGVLPTGGTGTTLALTPSTVAVGGTRKVELVHALAARPAGTVRARDAVDLAFSDDGTSLGIADGTGRVRIVRVATGKVLRIVEAPGVCALLWADNQRLLWADQEGGIATTDGETVDRAAGRALQLALGGPSGGVAVLDDGRLDLGDASVGDAPHVRRVAVAPRGTAVAVAGREGVWVGHWTDAETGPTWSCCDDRAAVDVSWHPEGRDLAVVLADGTCALGVGLAADGPSAV